MDIIEDRKDAFEPDGDDQRCNIWHSQSVSADNLNPNTRNYNEYRLVLNQQGSGGENS